ncbi:glycosyltransferase family 4 protein [Neolewinella agarilytica]|uniref:Glycosyltransferase involved in cell wall bisynthesis n=1 Tax=Neolewinella agarilytica TaxID=478744 RepID=A0A1H9MJ75_9BACT|nr:glycosyltransferase family 4 protein [Neolewinella agarilytica]SER23742.1 Glycosyltransferase involved in cell wall bisynthesis [Neolewinella agarilytica]
MEIIHLVMGKANPDRMNGVNKVVYQLATRQAQAGINVEVWGFTRELTVNYGERNFVTRLFLTPDHFACLDDDFLRALEKRNPKTTIFHLHGGWIPPFFKAAKAIKKAGLKYVITGHGAYNTIAMEKSKWTKKAYFQLFEKFLLQNAEAIHCIGASEVASLQVILPANRSVLIPYGMEFGRRARRRPKTGGPFIFGFVGRLDYHTKGLDLMLEAFAKHFRNDPDTSLWLVGDGAGRAAVVAKIEALGLTGNVILWGAKFGEEKDTLLQQMNVFLHPSRNEGLPSAVLEAASFGVPCIVTEATNVGGYVKKHRAGIVVPNQNIAMLGQAMKQCRSMHPYGLDEMSNNAAKMVATEFSWGHVLKQFNQLYA